MTLRRLDMYALCTCTASSSVDIPVPSTICDLKGSNLGRRARNGVHGGPLSEVHLHSITIRSMFF